MSSIHSSGIVPLIATEEAVSVAKEMCRYPFTIPKVFLDGSSEFYNHQTDFSWGDDGVAIVRDNCVTIYTKSSFTELLAEDENGNVIWVDGRNAPYEGCWGGKYLNKTRDAEEYRIVEYNLGTSEKKTYKVVPIESEPFDDRDLRKLNDFIDSEILDNVFEIDNGVLVMYNGSPDNIQIPDSVTKIAYYALSKYDTIDNLYIPKSVVEIAYGVFTDAVVKNVEVDPENPRYYCKDGLLIDRQTKTLLRAYAGNKIPEDGTVTSIGSRAFWRRSDITHIEIPDSVTKIERDAFSECINLEKAIVSDTVTIIESGAFYKCERLVEARLPSSITEIRGSMFADCSNLKSVIIPDNVTIIENDAFRDCSSLEKINIPDSVYKIEMNAFASCTLLSEIKLPSQLTEIPYGTFSGCSTLKHITIPQSVLQIGGNAFYGCSILEEIDVPNTVFEIGSYAFCGCTSLKKARLSNEIVTISRSLFAGCTQLSDVVIPQNVVEIEPYAFSNCTGLATITIPLSVRKIGVGAFSNTRLLTLTIPESVRVIESDAFNCQSLLHISYLPSRFVESGSKIFGGELLQIEDGSYYWDPFRSRAENNGGNESGFVEVFDPYDLPF